MKPGLAMFWTVVLVPGAGLAQDPGPPPAAPVQELLAREVLPTAEFLALVRTGATAVPALTALLSRSGALAAPLSPASQRALRALRLIGPAAAPEAVPVLLAAMARDISRDDTELLETLAVLAPGVPDRLALHRETAKVEIVNPNPREQGGMERFRRWVRKQAHWYRFRQRLAEDMVVAVPGLIGELEHEDPLHRERAAQLLGGLGDAAHAALPALTIAAAAEHPRVTRCDVGSLTADFHDLVRDAAAMAIARIDPEAEEAVRGLTLLLERADAPQERQAAAQALARVGDEARLAAVTALVAATAGDDVRVVGEAITALGQLRLAEPPVLAALERFARGSEPGLAARARVALQALASRVEPVRRE